MKNPEINIVKKMGPEQKKLLFFAPLGLLVLIICGYVLFTKDGPANNDNDKTSSNWDLPNDSHKEIPSTVLEINDQLEKHNNKGPHNNNSDFFEDLYNVPISKSNENKSLDSLKRNKDLMYSKIQQQLKTLNQPKPAPKVSMTREVRQSDLEKKTDKEPENSVDIHDFFKNKAMPNTTSFGSEQPVELKIRAVIHNDQEVKNNERIKLRLLEDVTLNGRTYERNTFVFGFASFRENRVLVSVKNIKNEPVDLDCYDTMDGYEGIYIEGVNIVGEFSKTGAEDLVSDVDVSRVPLGNTLKNLFRKKNRETSVFLQNNYEVILK